MGVVIRFPRRNRAKAGRADRPLFPGLIPGDPSADEPRRAKTDARKAKFRSDASPHTEPPPGVAPDPERARRHRRRRRSAITIGATVFVLGLVVSLFAHEGVFDVRRQTADYARLKAEVAAHQLRVQALKQRVDDLTRDPASVEGLAREQLGYAAPGEVLLLLPGEDPGAAPGLDRTPGSGIVSPVRSTP